MADEAEVLTLARNVTDKFSRKYLGSDAVEWYIRSGSCDNDMKNDIPNMLLLTRNKTIIGMMIWHDNLMHLLMIDIPYHGTGAAQYFCDRVVPPKLQKFGEVRLECFDKNKRGNAYYKKTGWVEYDRIIDEMTGGYRILYRKLWQGKRK